jgi:hypothetical protein
VGPRAVLDAVVKRKIPSPRLSAEKRGSAPVLPHVIRAEIKYVLCVYIMYSLNTAIATRGKKKVKCKVVPVLN